MPTATPPAAPTLRYYPLSVERYHRMIEANILNETDELELIEGLLVPKMPHGNDHDTAIELMTPLFIRMLPPTASVRCQCAMTLPDSEPEPDFAVCTPSQARGGRHPTPADTFLVVEVSDSTLYLDRTVKQRIYARAGIAVYWIVNLEDGRIEVYTDPASPPGADPHYRTRTDYLPGQSVPLVVAGTSAGAVPVDAILPKP